MKNKWMAIFIITAGMIGFASADTNLKENQVCFNASIESYSLLGYSIDYDQTLDPNIRISKDKHCLIINANRQSSTLPVDWIKTEFANEWIEWAKGNMSHTITWGSSTPATLNFAVNLDLYFSTPYYTCKNIFLGQGNTGGVNNWWFFSNNNNQDHTISCFTTVGNRPESIGVENNYSNNHYTFDLIF